MINNKNYNKQAALGAVIGNEEPRAKHTPGPWNVGANFHQTGNILDDKDNVIAKIPYAQTDTVGIAKDNAALIAAAPEMLEALELVETYIKGQKKIPGDLAVVFHQVLEAIAKAKGGAK